MSLVTEPNQPWRLVHSEASLGWGGQEHRVLAELTGFRRRGSSVELLTPRTSELFRRARTHGISVVPLHAGKLAFPLTVLRLARWLRRQRVQVLNPHSSRDGWLLGIAGRVARVPLIIRTRHIDVDYPNRWLSRHAFTTFADHLLTTSDKIKRHFQEMFGLADNRISTVPTGIDLDDFAPRSPAADFGPAPTGTPRIGIVSVLRSWKGHGTFLEAAARLKADGFSGGFVIVGEGPIRGKIEQQITGLGLRDAVTMTGHREDVPAVLRALSVLVIPSTKHEGVPQIGLQALAVQTPVVGSDVGGIPEIIRAGETGRIFPAGHAGALAAAIQETLADVEQTRACCQRGRAMVEAHHSVDTMLDSLEAIYRRHLPR